MNRLYISLTAALLLLVASCRGSKDVVPGGDFTTYNATAPVMERATAIVNGNLPWHTLQTGGSMTIGADGHDFSCSMQLRMTRDEQVVISLRPLLGIEMGKMIIARDSVLMIDKWHKQYMLEPVSVITSGIDVTIGNLQDIFLGRPFSVGESQLGKWTASGDTPLDLAPAQSSPLFKYGFTFDTAGHITGLHVTPLKGNEVGEYNVSYSGVEDTSRGPVPSTVDAAATIHGKPMRLQLDLNNVQWEKNVKSEDFVAPKGYKRIDIKRMMSLFGD